MKILSKTRYEKESDPFDLKGILFEIDLPMIYFAKAAIDVAKSVLPLVPENHKKVSLPAIEAAEKYLLDKFKQEEACKVDASAAAYRAARQSIGDNNVTFDEMYPDVNAAETADGAVAKLFNAIDAFIDDDDDNDDVAYYTYLVAILAGSAICYTPNQALDIAKIDAAACDLLMQAIPWELVCATQIVNDFAQRLVYYYVMTRSKEECKERTKERVNLIEKFVKDENLINYATIILEDENLRNQFEFLMKDYMNK